jgi:hypothetical protein
MMRYDLGALSVHEELCFGAQSLSLYVGRMGKLDVFGSLEAADFLVAAS